MKRVLMLVVLIVFMMLYGARSYAGGPLNTVDGEAVVYPDSDFPIPYHVDQGSLGSLSNSEGTSLVDSSFQEWQDVSTATITFTNGGQLPVDIIPGNYGVYDSNYTDGLNPIIFDTDGAIIEQEFGTGASDFVIGFAGSAFSTATGRYVEGLAVLNGKFTAMFSFEQFRATFVHEFGHFLGLDHTQINLEFAGDGNTSNDANLPTMFPTSTDDDTLLAELNPDDEAALTLLYPGSTADSAYGTITGTVKRGTGKAVRGANVVAVQIGDEDFSRFSSVSDYYQQNDGAFEMLVTPGTYKLFIEPINAAFTGGSGVGPYTADSNDDSFDDPVTTEFYNGVDESNSEPDLNAFEEVNVAAGETVSDIDFIAEGGPALTTTTTAAETTTTTTTVSAETTTTTTQPDMATTTTSVPEPLSVDFEGSPTSGSAPLMVEFKDLSSGPLDTYVWDFGDGTTGSEPNTFHTYDNPGSYTVSLTVTATDGRMETASKQDYITVSRRCPFAATLDNAAHLATLYQLRDSWRDHFSGRFIMQVFYANADEVTRILSDHPELRNRLKNLVAENSGFAADAAQSGTAIIPEENVDDITAFIKDLKQEGSPKLVFYADLVIQKIRNGTLLESIGITVQ